MNASRGMRRRHAGNFDRSKGAIYDPIRKSTTFPRISQIDESMKKFYAYVRVSTARQGEQGVSLEAQRDAITRYAERNSLVIDESFEERETAAKRGRPVFGRMLKLLRQGRASGVIIHKIDRSARNLKDWADLGELIDHGIEVHFANESLDLHSRGGRLSADIQAVVAADYIRNLREETRKGFYGRIKQGLFPLPAPLGYLDCGKGKPKDIDPLKGPLVRKAFELYRTGRYNLEGLTEELYRLGLRNRHGRKLSLNGISVILNNPFYIGLIRLKRTRETFPGNQEPLISKSLFDQVQRILDGRTPARAVMHDFLFRRLLTCKGCGYSLIGERQKGHAYYRCHTASCPTTCVREEAVETAVVERLQPLQFDQREKRYLRAKTIQLKAGWEEQQTAHVDALELRFNQFQNRLGRLTDAYLDGAVERTLFEERKAVLLLERRDVEEKLAALKTNGRPISDRLSEFLELACSAYSLWKKALPEEKRDLLRIVTSNRGVEGRNVDVMLTHPFRLVAERHENSHGAPYRGVPRTGSALIQALWRWFAENPLATFQYDTRGDDAKGVEAAA